MDQVKQEIAETIADDSLASPETSMDNRYRMAAIDSGSFSDIAAAKEITSDRKVYEVGRKENLPTRVD